MWKKPSFFWIEKWVTPLILLTKKCAIVTFAEKLQIKIANLNKQKHEYLIHKLSEKGFKGIGVNQAVPSLHQGQLKIQSFFYPKIYIFFNVSNIFVSERPYVAVSVQFPSLQLTLWKKFRKRRHFKFPVKHEYFFWWSLVLPNWSDFISFYFFKLEYFFCWKKANLYLDIQVIFLIFFLLKKAILFLYI